MLKCYRLCFCLFLLLLGLNACCVSKNTVSTEEQNTTEITHIETYTPPALIENGGCEQPLTNTTFSKLLGKLQLESSELSRLETTKKICIANCLTSNQIVRLMNVFSFENNKLSVAQMAYLACYDPDNYFVVFRELSREQSKATLKEYIEKL